MDWGAAGSSRRWWEPGPVRHREPGSAGGAPRPLYFYCGMFCIQTFHCRRPGSGDPLCRGIWQVSPARVIYRGRGKRERMGSASYSSAAGLRAGRGTQEQLGKPGEGTSRWTWDILPHTGHPAGHRGCCPKGQSPGTVPSLFPPTLTHAAPRGVKVTPRTCRCHSHTSQQVEGGLPRPGTRSEAQHSSRWNCTLSQDKTHCWVPRELKIQSNE